MKFVKFGILWRPYKLQDKIEYTYYFYYWNWLPKEYRYFGYEQMHYDGVHESFGFWFFNWTWVTPWTRDDMKWR